MKARGELFALIGDRKIKLAENLVVDTGEEMLCYLLSGDTSTKGYVTHMGLGVGGTAPTESDTGLQSEISASSGSYERETVSATIIGSTVDFSATWSGSQGPWNITESGLFTVSGRTSGVMLNRATFTGIDKVVTQELKLTWRITFE